MPLLYEGRDIWGRMQDLYSEWRKNMDYCLVLRVAHECLGLLTLNFTLWPSEGSHR